MKTTKPLAIAVKLLSSTLKKIKLIFRKSSKIKNLKTLEIESVFFDMANAIIDNRK